MAIKFQIGFQAKETCCKLHRVMSVLSIMKNRSEEGQLSLQH